MPPLAASGVAEAYGRWPTSSPKDELPHLSRLRLPASYSTFLPSEQGQRGSMPAGKSQQKQAQALETGESPPQLRTQPGPLRPFSRQSQLDNQPHYHRQQRIQQSNTRQKQLQQGQQGQQRLQYERENSPISFEQGLQLLQLQQHLELLHYQQAMSQGGQPFSSPPAWRLPTAQLEHSTPATWTQHKEGVDRVGQFGPKAHKHSRRGDKRKNKYKASPMSSPQSVLSPPASDVATSQDAWEEIVWPGFGWQELTHIPNLQFRSGISSPAVCRRVREKGDESLPSQEDFEAACFDRVKLLGVE